MGIDLWPIVGRAQLVQTFRPGEPGSREAPFRTLRLHGWSTAGVSVVTRRAQRASGRLIIFSVLNVEAARCAREGCSRPATALAKAAARVERSGVFEHLKTLLSGMPLTRAVAAITGGVPESQWPELHHVLRLLARETRAARPRSPTGSLEVVAGKITEAGRDVLVLETASGAFIGVPRWLGHSAHREHVGDCLGLVTDKLDATQMVVRAVPAIDVDASPRAFSPFGRKAPVHALTAADARLLARTPAPLKVLVPVTIER